MNSSTYGNSTRVLLPDYWTEPAALMVVRLFLEVGIAFFGVLGNIVVLIVMTKHSYMNFPMTSYIVDLAVADLGILAINFPFAVIKEQIRNQWVLGEFLCLTLYPLCEVFYGVSVWSITAVAVERYRSIVGTASLVHQTSKRGVVAILTTIWVTSFLVITLPVLLSIKYFPGYKACVTEFSPQSMSQLYFTTEVIFWFVLPLGVISYTYYKISRRIAQSNEFHRNMQNQLDQQQSASGRRKLDATRQNNKAKKILTPLVVVFTATMLPPNIFRLVIAFVPAVSWNRYFPVLYNIFIILSVAHSAINPVIYCMVSKEFRQGVKKIIPKCLRNRVFSRKSSRNITACSTSTFTLKNTERFPEIELLDIQKIITERYTR